MNLKSTLCLEIFIKTETKSEKEKRMYASRFNLTPNESVRKREKGALFVNSHNNKTQK